MKLTFIRNIINTALLVSIIVFFQHPIATASALNPDNLEWTATTEGVQFIFEGVESIKFETMELAEDFKLVIDFIDCNWESLKGRTRKEIEKIPVKRARFGQFTPTVARLVFDLDFNCEYEISREAGSLKIFLKTIERKMVEKSANIVEPPAVIAPVEESAVISTEPVEPEKKMITAPKPEKKEPLKKIAKPENFLSATKPPMSSNLITLDLKDADLSNVLRLLSQSSGMNIVASSDIGGRVTVSLKNVALKDALDSILKINGYSYVIEGNIIKVAPAQVMANLPDPFSTKIFKLQFALAEEAARPIKSILSKNGSIEVLRSSNSLMITDMQDYIDKVSAVIRHLDSKDLWDKKKNEFFEETRVIKLKYMVASTIKNIINRMTTSAAGIIEFDDNINAVIVTGVKEYVEQIESIITKIDFATRDDIEASLTQVFLLKYSKAESIKDAIEKILGAHTALTTHKNNFFKIVIDERTNAVIINTNIRKYLKVVNDIVEQLDVPVRQVLIEAKFIEVGLDKDNSLGIDWSQFGNVNINVNDPVSYNIGNWKPTFGTLTVKQFNLFLKNLDSNSNLNLLSSPRIATLDNQKAMIKISDDIITDIQTTESQSGNITQTPIRTEVGISLEVLPRINSDTYITLELAPQVNEARKSVLSSGVDIIRREAKTTVVVQNGNTIAIGGLIKNNSTNTNAGVPFLNKIPILNLLFAHRTTVIRKTELVIFITPTIITKANFITDKERDYLNRAIEQSELMHIDTLEY